jgi:hypothetical protein
VAMVSTGMKSDVSQGFLIGKTVNPFTVYGRRGLHMSKSGVARFLTAMIPLADANHPLPDLHLQCDDVDPTKSAAADDCVASGIPVSDGTSVTVTLGRQGWSVIRP